MQLNPLTSALRGRRVAVTGGNGFLGRHILAALQGADCADIAAPRRTQYDLTKPEDVERFYAEIRPDVVIHAAATVGGIGANAEHPGRFFYENIVMGVHLIEAGRRANVEKMVVLGTVCAYPKFARIPFREDELWDGYPEETNAPYGIAKKALLVQLQAYRAEFGTRGIFLLPVNLYGPGDNFDPASSHVIPALIRKCEEAIRQGSREIVVWGDGSPTREFLYVGDAARGIVAAAAYYDDAEPINLGSSEEISIKDLAELIADRTGFTGEIRWDTTKPNGQPRRKLDTRRAEERFGFRSSTAFSKGLDETIAWYRANFAHVNA